MNADRKRITVGVTGGISAYKAASLVSYLAKEHEVHVIMTKNATNFITPLTLETLSKHKVMVDEFEYFNYETIEHIEFGQNTDLIVIAPATANIIGKIANGIADDLLSSTVIAATAPVLICPAMNEKMYLNRIVQDNIKKLKDYGFFILEPASGALACGVEGIGKLPNTKTIVERITHILKED